MKKEICLGCFLFVLLAVTNLGAEEKEMTNAEKEIKKAERTTKSSEPLKSVKRSEESDGFKPHFFFFPILKLGYYSPQIGGSFDVSLLNIYFFKNDEYTFDIGGEIGSFGKGYIGFNRRFEFSKDSTGGIVSLRAAYWYGLVDYEKLEAKEEYYGVEVMIGFRVFVLNAGLKGGYMVSQGKHDEKEDPFFTFSFGLGLGF